MIVPGPLIDRAALSRVPYAPKKYTGWVHATIAAGQSIFGEQWDDAERALGAFGVADRAALIDAEVKRRMPLPQMPPIAAPARQALRSAGKPVDPEILERIKTASERMRAEREALAAEVDKVTPPLMELAAQNSRRCEMLRKAQSALFDASVNSEVPTFWYRDGSHNLPPVLPPARLMALSCSHGGMINLHQRGYIWHEKGAWYVFADTEKLAEKFPRHTSTEHAIGSIPMDALSPYLRLLIAVAQKQGITADNHSTRDSLCADLLAEAPKFGLSVGSGNSGSDLSPTWAEELAKAIRWPNARLGMAKGRTQKP